MRPPCEVFVKEILPELRTVVVQRLAREYNMKQVEIAQRIGITQAAVSQYLSRNERSSLDIRTLELANSLADFIVSQRISAWEIMKRVCNICGDLRNRKTLCEAHVTLYSALKDLEHCICPEATPPKDIRPDKYDVLMKMTDAVYLLENSAFTYKLVPEVRMNIVMAVKGAEDIKDIAAVPGRLTVIRNKVKGLEKPRFGASKHLSRVILAYMKHRPEFAACINIRNTENIRKTIKKLGFKLAEIDEEKLSVENRERDLLREIEMVAAEQKVDAVADPGGRYIEPVIYLFGVDAEDVARKAIRIADKL